MPAFHFSSSPRRRHLALGFLPLIDAAPLIVAQQLGLFFRRGLDVRLQREVGWATLRERVIHDEIDGAHAPAPMLWSAALGCGCAPVEVLTALVLNQHGNAITLAQKLWLAGVRDGAGLRAHAHRRRASERLTFAVPFRFSSHHLLLRRWLQSAGIDPERDVRIVVLPPGQMVSRLAAGAVDGYCVGEPWNSVAVREGLGWCPAWSAALARGEPEKVLMVRRAFAEKHPAEHAALVAALAEACAWCDLPANRPRLAEMLAAEDFLNVPVAALLPSLTGPFDAGNQKVASVPDFFVFHAGEANRPSFAKAQAMQEELVRAETLAIDDRLAGLPARLFREDLYRAALGEDGAPPAKLPQLKAVNG